MIARAAQRAEVNEGSAEPLATYYLVYTQYLALILASALYIYIASFLSLSLSLSLSLCLPLSLSP